MAPDSSKFYSKSLTLLIPILKMINDGFTSAKIAKMLHISKSLISYYITKAKNLGYIKENGRDAFKLYELTQPGKNFVDQYDKLLQQQGTRLPICRAENIQFKAKIHKMPTQPMLDWDKIPMNNWSQYNSTVDNIRVRINEGNRPSIVFIPSPVDGDDPYRLYSMLLYDCTEVAKKLEQNLDMIIGRLELSSRGEWLIYDPVAKAFCKNNGQVEIDGVCKINASKPRSIGEFEFHDPRALADYIAMPKRVEKLEQQVGEILGIVRERENLRNKKDDKIQNMENQKK
jgi:hypothetical protein